MQDLFSLKGRIALVTGGSRSIGEMIAEGYVKAGAKVYISSRKGSACEETAERLSAFGECVAIPADASGASGAQNLAGLYLAGESRLDILVNNAGAAWGAEIEGFPESGWDKVMDLNVKAPFFLVKALLGALRAGASAERPAKVINIASIDGLSVNMQPTYSYAASKAGLIHLTKRLALELAPQHIVVSARLCLQHEQGRVRSRRRPGQAHPRPPDRDARGHGGRRDLSRLARGRLCRGRCLGRRWRRRLDAAGDGMIGKRLTPRD